jgi:hypothetical protein
MIHFMRYAAIWLWLTLLVGGIGSLATLPVLRPLVDIDLIPFVVAGGLATVFTCVAWTVNRIAMRRVARWMRRAEAAEREGLSPDAEAALRTALAALDRFWISPASRHNTLRLLAGRLARLYLPQARFDDAAKDFISGYLDAYPEDEELATQWTQQLRLPVSRSGSEMEVPAFFRRRKEAWDAAETAADETPTPTDAWAETQSGFRMSTAADVGDDEGSEERAFLLARPRTVGPHLRRVTQAVGSSLTTVLEAMGRMGAGLGHLMRCTFRLRGVRYGMAALALVVLAAGGLWVGLEVGEHFDTPSPEPADADAPVPVPAAVADPFTLQVAAYLKQEFALKRVEELKRKGLDAYWTETSSGGKLWYQVRIAHFPDQATARAYGRILKDKGVIDDFYVTGYVR